MRTFTWLASGLLLLAITVPLRAEDRPAPATPPAADQQSTAPTAADANQECGCPGTAGKCCSAGAADAPAQAPKPAGCGCGAAKMKTSAAAQ
jgi:hypothetical protein